MKLYCYHIAPIDYWLGALTADQVMSAANDEVLGPHSQSDAYAEITRLKDRAEAVFRTSGWEGDVRERPFYFPVPGDTRMRGRYALKQDNNGNCFVASPIPIAPNVLHIFDQGAVE